MSDQILDNFEDFEDLFEAGTKIVVAKYFFFESKARIYAARLNEAGIKSFISNANTISVIPLGEGGIGLHVKEEDLPRALSIIRKMDSMEGKDPTNVSYHDADKEDIAYEQDISMQKSRRYEPAILILVAIILLTLVHAILKGFSFY
ncbi:MAG: DUF2007 domain-containing protein [Bacteroidota bacterium]